MAAEFMAGLLAPQLADRVPVFPADWNPTAGELRALRFDSRGSTFSAQLSGAELVRASDHLRVSNLAAQVQYDEKELRLSFAPDVTTSLRVAGDENPRAFNLGGQLVVSNNSGGIEFEAFDARSGAMSLTAQGEWGGGRPLMLTVTNLDRALMRDAWNLLAHEAEPPALFTDIQEGSVVEGVLNLVSMRDAGGSEHRELAALHRHAESRGARHGERGPAATRGRTRHGRVRARQHEGSARRR